MNPGITATTTSGLNAPHNAAISARKLTLATTRILAEVSQGVGWITLNNPESRNAVSLKTWGTGRRGRQSRPMPTVSSC